MKTTYHSSIFSLLFGAFLLGGIVAARAQCVAPPAGIVAWWGAEGNADDRVGTNNGTIVGGVTFAAGQVGQTFVFDGTTGDVDMSDVLDMGTSDFTIEGWINGDPAMEGWGRIIDKGFASGYAFGRRADSNKVSFEYLDSGSQGNGFATLSDVIDNTWHHVAVVVQSHVATLYADGVAENSETVSANPQDDALPLLVGFNPGQGLLGHWKGMIDELSIYNRALSATEVAAIAGAGNSGKCTRDAIRAVWKVNPRSADWNDSANWSGRIVPNQSGDGVLFGVSNTTTITSSSGIDVGSISFNQGASAYNFNGWDGKLLLSGSGIVNSSGIVQTFIGNTAGGVLWRGGATAGNLTSYTVNGGAAQGEPGGDLTFSENSTAANATLIANAGTNGGGPGTIEFLESSLSGNARIVLNGGTLNYEGHDGHAVLAAGSIEGTSGSVSLGGLRLTVGSNSLNTEFDGTISGTGGALSKAGTGALILGGANSYTGATTVVGGTLLLRTNGNSSQTGTGPVTVSAGVLGGDGRVGGPVTIGNGSGARGVLAPGYTGDTAGSGIFMPKKLTFRADGDFDVEVNTDTLDADQVTAKGITIQAGAILNLSDVGNTLLPQGTCFTLVNNTSSGPVGGTFAGLPEGAQIMVGPNVFIISYHAGDGNDIWVCN